MNVEGGGVVEEPVEEGVSRDMKFPALVSRDGCNTCSQDFGWRAPV